MYYFSEHITVVKQSISVYHYDIPIRPKKLEVIYST
jgi:hypothetical protein